MKKFLSKENGQGAVEVAIILIVVFAVGIALILAALSNPAIAAGWNCFKTGE